MDFSSRPLRLWRFLNSLRGCNHRTATCLVLGLILAAALVLRTYRLGNELVFSDEAFSWRVSSCALLDLVKRVAGDTAPLSHFLILKAWLATVGTSPVEMRSLSVIFGLATVLMVYQLCADAIRLRLRSQNRADGDWPIAAYLGSLFAATLVAIHASQISASRIIRMYSQGCFLAAASSWCLLKALYSPVQNGDCLASRLEKCLPSTVPKACLSAFSTQGLWWIAYALLAAAALHTHNFALFMVAAQFLYVALVLIFPSNLVTDRRKTLRLAAMAFCLVALLYGPWIPTFLQQTARVHQNFWLPDISVRLLSGTFTTWLTGLRGGDATWFAAVWMACLLAMTAYTIRKRDELGLFFLLPALLPWIATVLIATLGSRPLLDDRYLVFSQITLLTYWGYICAQLPSLMINLLIAVNLLIPTVAGTNDYLASIPVRPPSIISATEFMRHAYQPGDMIIAPDARELNMFKYYASQAGWHDFEIRCPPVEHEPGHVNHISSLSPDDWLWTREAPEQAHTLWILNQPPAWNLSGGWTETSSRGYAPMDRSWVYGLLIRRYQVSTPQN